MGMNTGVNMRMNVNMNVNMSIRNLLYATIRNFNSAWTPNETANYFVWTNRNKSTHKHTKQVFLLKYF